MVPCPAARPVTKPLALTLIRAGLRECQVTAWSTLDEVPELPNTVADS